MRSRFGGRKPSIEVAALLALPGADALGNAVRQCVEQPFDQIGEVCAVTRQPGASRWRGDGGARASLCHVGQPRPKSSERPA
jgi:hypothetical protein